MASTSGPDGVTARQVLGEGRTIIAIALFWGLLAAVARYGIGNIGYHQPGSVFFELGWNLAILFTVTGFASVLLFVVARGIQLADASE